LFLFDLLSILLAGAGSSHRGTYGDEFQALLISQLIYLMSWIQKFPAWFFSWLI
jgi:hypothetical protein